MKRSQLNLISFTSSNLPSCATAAELVEVERTEYVGAIIKYNAPIVAGLAEVKVIKRDADQYTVRTTKNHRLAAGFSYDDCTVAGTLAKGAIMAFDRSFYSGIEYPRWSKALEYQDFAHLANHLQKAANLEAEIETIEMAMAIILGVFDKKTRSVHPNAAVSFIYDDDFEAYEDPLPKFHGVRVEHNAWVRVLTDGSSLMVTDRFSRRSGSQSAQLSLADPDSIKEARKRITSALLRQ